MKCLRVRFTSMLTVDRRLGDDDHYGRNNGYFDHQSSASKARPVGRGDPAACNIAGTCQLCGDTYTHGESPLEC